jgi:hypothetical protein
MQIAWLVFDPIKPDPIFLLGRWIEQNSVPVGFHDGTSLLRKDAGQY